LRHLSLADGQFTPGGRAAFDPIFHCPHAGPSGGGICTEALVDGATPHEHWRVGATTARRLGYCDISADDKVAECTKSFITDANFHVALSLIPSSVEYIFMNDNRGITHLPSGIFESLECPECVRSLFIEDCNITTLAPDAFSPLVNLEVISLTQNLISELPEGIFYNNPRLREFNMFQAGPRPGLLTSLPADLFRYNRDMERFVCYGHPQLTAFPPGIFDGLTSLEIISFVVCGFTNEGFPPGVFSDLHSLRYFDFFGNGLTSIDAAWFEGGWGSSILRLALDNNPITHIDAGAYDTLDSLEVAYMHGCPIDTIPDGLFANNHNLISYTLGVNPN